MEFFRSMCSSLGNPQNPRGMARDTVFSVRACHFAPRQLRQQGNERPYYIKEVQAVKEEGWAERLTNNCTTVCEWNKGISPYIRRYTYAAIYGRPYAFGETLLIFSR